MAFRLARTIAAVAAAFLAGCSLAGGPAATTVASHQSVAASQRSKPGFQGRIQHVVIIIQENRTIDNLFNGFPGADTVTQGQTHNGKSITLQTVSLAAPEDVCHEHRCWKLAYNDGQMNGFDLYGTPGESPTFPYAKVPVSETVPIWTLAQEFTLGDRMFQSNTGPSYPAHQYLISGQAADVADNPTMPYNNNTWGCDSPRGTYTEILGGNGQLSRGPFPCFDYQTLGDEMDQNGVSWRYYATAIGGSGGVWSAYDAIKHIRFGHDWRRDVISPETQFINDVNNGQLAQVTWITPSRVNSDHAGSGSTSGPQWVASLVNAVGQSPYWNDTAIFIVWDDFGGWYDHVQPPQLDNMGLGFRVPLIVVSPYAQNGYVSHQQHEFGSILHFTEEAFGLPSLGTTDQRADDLSDCFNFFRTPTRYKPVATRMKPADFFAQPRTNESPDD